jgi:hypothetical protein
VHVPWGRTVVGLACVAVAAGSLSAPALASPTPQQRPADAPSMGLNAVSAVSTSDAWAVGDFWPSRSEYASTTLVEHWDGTRWTRVPSPSPGVLDALQGVSARSGDDVWAVGYYEDPVFFGHGLIEHWDGQVWTSVPFPDPGVESGLRAISAVSATDVWATGYFWDSEQNSHSLIEHWDGSTWTIVPTTVPILVGQSLSADSASDVWGVAGDSIGHWDGHGWNPVTDPNLHSRDTLFSVSAYSPADVWVAGILEGGRPLIDHWDGATWTSMPSPIGSASYLKGVHAVSASDVWAVGGVYETRTLIEHWDGTAWTRVPRGGTPRHGWLVGVTATSASDVWAVGQSRSHAIIVHFDGTSWTRF